LREWPAYPSGGFKDELAASTRLGRIWKGLDLNEDVNEAVADPFRYVILDVIDDGTGPVYGRDRYELDANALTKACAEHEA
jgi:hypothetical protein